MGASWSRLSEWLLLLLVKEQVDPGSPGVVIDSVGATCHPGPLSFPLLRVWTASLNHK